MSKRRMYPVEDHDGIRKEMMRNFYIELTDEQIDRFTLTVPARVRKDIASSVGGLDTYDRNYLIDGILEAIIGDGAHWPLNMEVGTEYSNAFPELFYKACAENDIKVVC